MPFRTLELCGVVYSVLLVFCQTDFGVLHNILKYIAGLVMFTIVGVELQYRMSISSQLRLIHFRGFNRFIFSFICAFFVNLGAC